MDYKEAIGIFENEIKKLNTRPIHVNHIGDAEKADDAMKTAISVMQELEEYKQLGTLEEVREAVEKQKKKKPIEDRHHRIRYIEVYRCPSCNGSFSGRGFAKYCYHCGQAINWSEEE